ncbi:MAG: EutN/CcmL family microcompartment protein [Candidatus Sumerlaeaceae bacterium]|nr:EutN/CcmL family microcompartment protein [Candidatus Sumerlaeaceae bacterium]
MDIARVIGTVVATRKVPSLDSATLLVLQPLNERLEEAGTALIATDATSRRGPGEIVYFVTSGDAVFTGLHGEDIPVDAAVIGIVDSIHTVG